MNYVIIGNSAAAIGCIEGIRSIDTEGNITVISDEIHNTYSRPLISYLLYGKTDRNKMKYRNEEFYKKMRVTTIFGKRAVSIDPESKSVVLEDNLRIDYDKLLIATGSRPFVPPMNGLDSIKYHTFMSLDDAIGLESELGADKKVLIVGAGLIGLKAAEGILDKVESITVVDLADRVLPSILDAQGSEIIKNSLEKKGVKFILSDSVDEFTPGKAVLKSAKTVEFDVCIIAVGVRPNTELLKDAGGCVNRGICTDEYQQTSIPSIYAAGDCTESYDICANENRILALLPNAYMQGEVAGLNMAGKEKKYEYAIPMNAMGLFGLHMITAGSYDGESFIVENSEESYKRLVVADGVLKGYIIIGDIKRAGIYTALIRDRVPLCEIDFDLIKEKPQLMAFSLTARKEKLGNVKAAN